MIVTEHRLRCRVIVAIGLAALAGVDTSHVFRVTGEKRANSIMTCPPWAVPPGLWGKEIMPEARLHVKSFSLLYLT